MLLSEKDRQYLENGADQLEELFHPAAEVMRRIARGPKEFSLEDIREFMEEDGCQRILRVPSAQLMDVSIPAPGEGEHAGFLRVNLSTIVSTLR